MAAQGVGGALGEGSQAGGDVVQAMRCARTGWALHAAPDAFSWCGGRYVVRAVLGHWSQRRRDGSPAGAHRVVWRVEASRLGDEGLVETAVYELAHDLPIRFARAGSPEANGVWRVLTVGDGAAGGRGSR